jgi:hypothetical protein
VSGIITILHRADAPPDHVAEHDDPPVDGGEMLEPVPRDASVNADLRVVITGDALPFAWPVRPAQNLNRAEASILRRAVEPDLHGVRSSRGTAHVVAARPVDRRAFGHRVCVRRELVDIGE